MVRMWRYQGRQPLAPETPSTLTIYKSTLRLCSNDLGLELFPSECPPSQPRWWPDFVLRGGLGSLLLAMLAIVRERCWWYLYVSMLSLWALKITPLLSLASAPSIGGKQIHGERGLALHVVPAHTRGRDRTGERRGSLLFHRSGPPSKKHFFWGWVDGLGFEEILVEMFSWKTVIVRKELCVTEAQTL